MPLKTFYVQRIRYVPEVRLYKVTAGTETDAVDRAARGSVAGDTFNVVREGSDAVRLAYMNNSVTVLP